MRTHQLQMESKSSRNLRRRTTMMKKTIRSAIKMFLFGAIVLAICIFPGIADAHSYFSATVTLPYEVHWGLAVLQPGDYLIRVGSLYQPAQIYSKTGKHMFFTSARFTDLNSEGEPRLMITSDGNKHVVNSLTMPLFGVSLIYEPLTKIQRENIAKGDHVQDRIAVTALK
jgi:hypothetical protein